MQLTAISWSDRKTAAVWLQAAELLVSVEKVTVIVIAWCVFSNGEKKSVWVQYKAIKGDRLHMLLEAELKRHKLWLHCIVVCCFISFWV